MFQIFQIGLAQFHGSKGMEVYPPSKKEFVVFNFGRGIDMIYLNFSHFPIAKFRYRAAVDSPVDSIIHAIDRAYGR